MALDSGQTVEPNLLSFIDGVNTESSVDPLEPFVAKMKAEHMAHEELMRHARQVVERCRLLDIGGQPAWLLLYRLTVQHGADCESRQELTNTGHLMKAGLSLYPTDQLLQLVHVVDQPLASRASVSFYEWLPPEDRAQIEKIAYALELGPRNVEYAPWVGAHPAGQAT